MIRGERLKISKTKKIALISVEAILILSLSLLAVFELAFPRYQETEAVYYTYDSKGSINHKVYLKPNSMFNEQYLEGERYYVLKYIDYINMEFEYDYTANSEAELEVEYGVSAYLQGLHGREEEVLWSKEIPLIPNKTQQEATSKFTINQKVSVNLKDYSAIAEKIYLDSEINAPVVLRVEFRIHTSALTKNGTIEDSINPYVIIPVNSSVFKIEGEPVVTGKDQISEMVKSRIPVDKGKMMILFSASFVLVLLLILTTRIEEAPPLDAFEKRIAAIFKEYSERLAGLEHSLSYHMSETINVNSFEDMVKIADEVGQPVFYYKVDDGIERRIEFFVFDNTRIYYLVIFGDIKASTD
jgi:hypothetical protein